MTEKKPTYDISFWLTLIGQIVFAFAIFIALSEWQASDMRDKGTQLNPLTSPTLDGNTLTFPNTDTERTTLLYFFAPWCTVCDFSMGNLNLLDEQFNTDTDIVIVALDYQSELEVAQFITDKNLKFPVILGDDRWAQEYNIRAFPSYYIISPQGTVLSRSMGYSSTLGMLTRIGLSN